MRRIVSALLLGAPLLAACGSSTASTPSTVAISSPANGGNSPAAAVSISDLCSRLTAARAAIHLTPAADVPPPTVTEHPSEVDPTLSRSSCDVIISFDAEGRPNAGLTMSLTTVAGYNALIPDLTGCFKGTIPSKVGTVLNYCSTKGGGLGASAAAAVQVGGQVVLLVGEAATKMTEDELVAAIDIIVGSKE